MEPISLGIVAGAIIGGIGGGGVGFVIGRAHNTVRVLLLQEQIARQIRIIKTNEERIAKLTGQIDVIRTQMGLFERFVSFVWCRNPELARAFAEREQVRRDEAAAREDMVRLEATLTEVRAAPPQESHSEVAPRRRKQWDVRFVKATFCSLGLPSSAEERISGRPA